MRDGPLAGVLGVAGFVLVAAPLPAQAPATGDSRREYAAMIASMPPAIDGQLNDSAWRAAAWSDSFVDIEGDLRPAPRYLTRVKLLWDSAFLYVGAELEEPDLWGTITTRDAVIFHDNDFEVFLDPGRDGRDYFELEINALGTVWDLFLPRTYRDGGQANSQWNIEGLRSAVALRGTINDPSDRDTSWSVELAIPWRSLAPPGRAGPAPGEGMSWRVNFSRVQWNLVAHGPGYAKRADPVTGKPLAEMNWVWSPQGVVDMHRPERWGEVHFLGDPGREPPR